MEPATILILVGMLVALVGWWPTVIEMFRESRLLGYIAFSLPAVAIFYAMINFEELKKQFWLQLAGFLAIGGGIYLDSPG